MLDKIERKTEIGDLIYKNNGLYKVIDIKINKDNERILELKPFDYD
jgi:hypothetical protein